jgi:ferrous iron transport protein A
LGVARVRLGELKPGEKARIVTIESQGDAVDFAARLMEMGMLEGSLVELMHEAPFGGDPVAVRVRGALIALRRGEANQVWVERA